KLKSQYSLFEMPMFKKAKEEPPVAVVQPVSTGDNHVLITLKQCDDQVLSMLDMPPPPSLSSTPFSLMDAITHPTLISPRFPLASKSDGGLASCIDIGKNSRRIFCQLIDFINSLRPVADFDISEKAAISKNVAPAFVLYTIVQYSINQQAPAHCLSLPLGQTVSRDLSLLEVPQEDSKGNVMAEMRVAELKGAVMDQLTIYTRELNLSDLEQSAIRALIVLEANYSLPEHRNALLGAARASILEALHGYLSSSYSKQESTIRFGNMMLLIGKVQQHASQVISFLQFLKDNHMPVDPILDRFLLSHSF
ncbi:hypothetical protein PFISCL1PPCAC_24412, partial [Pristionchus fissidentatus]